MGAASGAQPRKTQPWLGGFSAGFRCRAGCLEGKEAQCSGGEALQGLRALHRGVCPKAGAAWPSCPLPGPDGFSEQIFSSTREGLCPCDCGQISAPGCRTPEAATRRSLRDAVSGGSFRSWLSVLVFLSRPFQIPRGSAPRGGSVAFPLPPSPEPVPLPCPQGALPLPWVELHPGISPRELSRTVYSLLSRT